MLWLKKRKKVNRATRPIFKNQLTRTKVFFFLALHASGGDPEFSNGGGGANTRSSLVTEWRVS